jgi:hypothetical protein
LPGYGPCFWHNKYFREELLRVPIEIDIDGEIVVYGCVLVLPDFPHMDILEAELITKAGDIVLSKYE